MAQRACSRRKTVAGPGGEPPARVIAVCFSCGASFRPAIASEVELAALRYRHEVACRVGSNGRPGGTRARLWPPRRLWSRVMAAWRAG
jgi:hypothetical protein